MKTKEVEEYFEALEAIKVARKIGVIEEIREELWDREVQAWEALSKEQQGEEMTKKISPESLGKLIGLGEEEALLFKACKIDFSSLETWHKKIVPLNSADKVNLYYLMEHIGVDLEEALMQVDEPHVQAGCLLDVATAYFNEVELTRIPEDLRYLVDYKKVADHMRAEGGMAEFEYKGGTYTWTD